MTQSILPHRILGPEGTVPLVCVHGFAGDRDTWLALQVALQHRRRTIAFDLPGHGAALEWPRIGHAGVSMKELLASLDAMGIDAFHLVGHSMGGAIATMTALKLAETGRVKSLTLLAPGGFGAEINHRLLRSFAVATEPHELHALFGQFFGFEKHVPHAVAEQMAQHRADPRVTAALATVVEAILDGERQKGFDLATLAGLRHPVKLIWGTHDRVLPPTQARGVPGLVAVHMFDGVGHMPQLEIPREVARLVTEITAVA